MSRRVPSKGMLKAAHEAAIDEIERIETDVDKLVGQLAQFQDIIVDLKDTYRELLTAREWLDIT